MPGNAAGGTIHEMRSGYASIARSAVLAVLIAAGPATRAHAQQAAPPPQKGAEQAWQILSQPQSSLVYARDA